MSGDLRAKKNSRFSNKTGGNKKENPKGALDLQPYGLNDGEVDLSKEFSTVTSTEEGYEDISEDRIITTKVSLSLNFLLRKIQTFISYNCFHITYFKRLKI